MSTASRQEYRVVFTQQYAAKHTNIYFCLDHTQQILFTSHLPIGPHTTDTIYFTSSHWTTHNRDYVFSMAHPQHRLFTSANKLKLFTSPWTTHQQRLFTFPCSTHKQRLLTTPWTHANRGYLLPLGPLTSRDCLLPLGPHTNKDY